jgi:predicted TIM-barrel fold metal-dependent hydrolase
MGRLEEGDIRMSATVLDGIKVIDTDTHVIEPPDLWTSRVSTKRWGDLVPHVAWDEARHEEAWFFGDSRVSGAASPAMAFWNEYPPLHPTRYEQADPTTKEPKARLALMDEYGIHAQVLYPNVAGFGTGRLLAVRDTELMLACVRAYNDFLVDYAATAPGRFIPVAAVPFWDVDVAVREIERAASIGHRGIVFGSQPEAWGAPELTARHWDPIWAAAQAAELPVNFHIASGDLSEMENGNPENGMHANYAALGVSFFMGNARAIAKLTTGGICHRFPTLDFVSVESGIGWIPFALTALDWQWKNCGVAREHPEYDLLPSEYFRRQIFGCFWFERETLHSTIELLGDDNILYETDFPHPTSMTPGPATSAVAPREFLENSVADLPRPTVEKILHDNAARLYRLG